MTTRTIKTRLDALEATLDAADDRVTRIEWIMVAPSPDGPVRTGERLVAKQLPDGTWSGIHAE